MLLVGVPLDFFQWKKPKQNEKQVPWLIEWLKKKTPTSIIVNGPDNGQRVLGSPGWLGWETTHDNLRMITKCYWPTSSTPCFHCWLSRYPNNSVGFVNSWKPFGASLDLLGVTAFCLPVKVQPISSPLTDVSGWRSSNKFAGQQSSSTTVHSH